MQNQHAARGDLAGACIFTPSLTMGAERVARYTEVARGVRIAIDRGGTFTDCYATWEAPARSEVQSIHCWEVSLVVFDLNPLMCTFLGVKGCFMYIVRFVFI